MKPAHCKTMLIYMMIWIPNFLVKMVIMGAMSIAMAKLKPPINA
jgi:hypothetical protein